MMSMDQYRKGSTEGANPHFRPHRSSFAPHRHPNPNSNPNPNPNPNPILHQYRHQRKPPPRSQVANHDQPLASERLRCPPPAATSSISKACAEGMTAERLRCSPPAATNSISKASLEARAPGMTSERLRSPLPAATNSISKASPEARAMTSERLRCPPAATNPISKTCPEARAPGIATNSISKAFPEARAPAMTSERLRCSPPAATNSIPKASLEAMAPGMSSERLRCSPPAATNSISKASPEARAPGMTSERLRCAPAVTNSISKASLEARAPVMTMNEWWGDDKAELRRQALLDALIGGEHCIAYVVEEQRKSTKREERRGPITREEFIGVAGEEWQSITREERGSAVGGNQGDSAATVAKGRKKNSPAGRAHSLEARLAGIATMSEWWAVLSECVGTKRSLLHDEIVAFCKAQELTPQQARARGLAQDFLQRAVLDVWPNAEVHLYGSTAMGLALPTSDIDIVVVMQPTASAAEWKVSGGSCEPVGRPSPDTGPWVSELYRKLYEMESVFESLIQLPHAKVPILKAVFKSGVACDISFDWHSNRPGRGVQIVRHFLRQYKDLKPLCILLKSFLRHHKLNEVFKGGIGSFCLTIMIVSLLQNLPCEGAAAAAAGGPAGHDLGALLVSFFMYYSSMHNYATDVVSTTPGAHALHKHARRWVNWSDPERLAVENPLDPTSDIGSASYNIHDVRVKFSQAKRVLLRHWNEENLLDRVFKTCIV